MYFTYQSSQTETIHTRKEVVGREILGESTSPNIWLGSAEHNEIMDPIG